MFRYWIGLFTLACSAFVTQAQSSIGTNPAYGTNGGEPMCAHFSWYNVPTDVRAIAVANIVTMSASPLGTGLVNLATGVPVDPSTVGAADPLSYSLPNAAYGQGLGGGSVPPGFFKGGTTPAASGKPGSSGTPTGNASGGSAIAGPDNGWWAIGTDGTNGEATAPLVPVEIQPTIDTPEPATLLMGGLGLAAMAGYRLRKRSR